MKDYNITIDGRNFLNQLVRNLVRTYGAIWKIATGQRNHYTTACLLDCSYFKECHKMIVIDLSKQQAFHADPRAIEQVDFAGNLQQDGNTLLFLIFEESKNIYIVDSSQGTVRVLGIYFAFI